MIALAAELVEAFVTLRWVKSLPEWVTAFGVVYLVVAERRRARRLTALERTTQVLVDGHDGRPDSHRRIPAVLEEVADARH